MAGPFVIGIDGTAIMNFAIPFEGKNAISSRIWPANSLADNLDSWNYFNIFINVVNQI